MCARHKGGLHLAECSRSALSLRAFFREASGSGKGDMSLSSPGENPVRSTKQDILKQHQIRYTVLQYSLH